MEKVKSKMLSLARMVEVENWMKRTNTKLIQVNGQRKYGGPPDEWNGPVPGAHCEVFITHIPLDTYEDVLIPLFSAVGPLWEFRLMMNFSGQNRGFAYAKYGSQDVAARAIQLLHGHVIAPGVSLCVHHSTEKRQLCIEGLPGLIKQADLLEALQSICEGVEKVSVATEPGVAVKSAVVTFFSHYTASMAKKVVVEAFKKQYGLKVSVNWQPAVKPSLTQLPPSENLVNVSRQSPFLLPQQTPTLYSYPGFCRAAGGHSAPQEPHGFSITTSLVSATAPMTLLNSMCQTAGFGQPKFEISYRNAGPDGYLYFTYKVLVLGINMSFPGLIKILPGASVASTMEEVWGVVAQHVLHRMFHSQEFH